MVDRSLVVAWRVASNNVSMVRDTAFEDLLVTLLEGRQLHRMEDKNIEGERPLVWASRFSCTIPYAIRLLDFGADPNAAGQFGDTALGQACAMGSHKLVSALVERGADVECAAANHGGGRVNWYTPLMIAAVGGHVRVMNELLCAGADMYAKTRDGKTVADILSARSDRREETAFLTTFIYDRDVVLPATVRTLSSILPEDLAAYCGGFVSFVAIHARRGVKRTTRD